MRRAGKNSEGEGTGRAAAPMISTPLPPRRRGEATRHALRLARRGRRGTTTTRNDSQHDDDAARRGGKARQGDDAAGSPDNNSSDPANTTHDPPHEDTQDTRTHHTTLSSTPRGQPRQRAGMSTGGEARHNDTRRGEAQRMQDVNEARHTDAHSSAPAGNSPPPTPHDAGTHHAPLHDTLSATPLPLHVDRQAGSRPTDYPPDTTPVDPPPTDAAVSPPGTTPTPPRRSPTTTPPTTTPPPPG